MGVNILKLFMRYKGREIILRAKRKNKGNMRRSIGGIYMKIMEIIGINRIFIIRPINIIIDFDIFF